MCREACSVFRQRFQCGRMDGRNLESIAVRFLNKLVITKHTLVVTEHRLLILDHAFKYQASLPIFCLCKEINAIRRSGGRIKDSGIPYRPSRFQNIFDQLFRGIGFQIDKRLDEFEKSFRYFPGRMAIGRFVERLDDFLPRRIRRCYPQGLRLFFALRLLSRPFFFPFSPFAIFRYT